MFKPLIEAIYAKIAAELPEIKTKGLYNDQFNKSDEGKIDSFPKPAIFIGFPDQVEYKDRGSMVQTTENFRVRFYISIDMFKAEGLEIFDLKQKVYSVFQGYKLDGFGRFVRRNEQADEDRTNYYILIQDYETSAIDSEVFYLNRFDTHTVTDVEITPDLLIASSTKDGARTDNAINRL